MDAISKEARLLVVNKIDTAEQLSLYGDSLKSEMKSLTDERKELYKKSRTVEVKQDEKRLSETKAKISVLSKKIGKLRQEVRLCDDIAVRSGVIKEKLQTVREDENKQRKDLMKNEQFRRCGRTNR